MLSPSVSLPMTRSAAAVPDGVVRGLAALVFRSPPYRWSLRGRTPHATQPLDWVRWPTDGEVAAALLEGEFLFGGRRWPLGHVPWSGLPPGAALAVALHGFGWLASLEADGSEAARTRAGELIGGWIDTNGRWSDPAWRPDVLGRRIYAWLAAADFVMTGADDVFRRRMLDSVAVQSRHLARIAARPGGDAGVFAALKGQIATALALGIGRVEAVLTALAREIDRQILADGGHVARNPEAHLHVLRDLLDVRTMLQGARVDVPTAATGAIERMALMTRAVRLGDGGLFQVHGGSEGDRSLIDAVLAQAAVRGKPSGSAPYVGFQRLAASRTTILVDAGPPPATRGATAHAAPLAIEMSVGRQRLVVNCGAHAGDDSNWRQALRATAAHSTLTVDDTNAVALAEDGRLADTQPTVNVERREADGDSWLDGSHDGYRRLGLIHRRRMFVAASGEDVRGEDDLDCESKGAAGRGFAVRFHLHPQIQASMVQDGSAVLLRLPRGDGWRFLAVGGTLALEDSIYFGSGHTPRRTRQIVVSGAVESGGAQVKWALRREATGSG